MFSLIRLNHSNESILFTSKKNELLTTSLNNVGKVGARLKRIFWLSKNLQKINNFLFAVLHLPRLNDLYPLRGKLKVVFSIY